MIILRFPNFKINQFNNTLEGIEHGGETIKVNHLAFGFGNNVYELEHNISGYPNSILIYRGHGNIEGDSSEIYHILQNIDDGDLFLCTHDELESRFILHPRDAISISKILKMKN